MYFRCLQVLNSGLSSTNLVVWDQRWGGVSISGRKLQRILPGAIGPNLQEIWAPALQHGTNSWVGHQARPVPALNLRGPSVRLPVFFGKARKVVPLSCGRLHGELKRANEREVLYDPDRLHTYKRRAVFRLSSDISWCVQGEAEAFLKGFCTPI